ncbi:putative L-lactate dehydrogenase, Iron-sulfur cluster-binding subunit YkgF [Acidisarcina polymorpha]|uniref:Putative L-lactate dehydrogenase, Iron-sulfur cluster-binding subunit YkgF n=1 Tax=Acidisarcina polymorpha TaxID=2211140 RepID=A0A2Z5FXX5_9BACT|nr:LutB/LldF family L-lactate oxidation iron-sulfur protein [Acidisarcina polymorpha]AXC11728.1 putative L-lactate dehydrogenase, Iron-sulfur cluster-binding subunit YkgF [Acidisarcina polymorpha]
MTTPGTTPAAGLINIAPPQVEWPQGDFPTAAHQLLKDSQLRKNVRHATNVINAKRAIVVGEMPDWEHLRDAGSAIKQHTLDHLDQYLLEFEAACTAAGGHVHWAVDAAEANRIAVEIVRRHQVSEVIKIKSMTTEEIELNHALEAAGVHPTETDLAELIIQMGHDKPSHIIVPALHKNRGQVREMFRREMNLPDLGDTPEDLADAARRYLREKFLSVKVAISGANFLIAETGGVCILESEGNGRMCLTLPDVLISVVGLEKVIPRFRDLEVFLQTLPRSSTGERMNPYNSIWTGVRPGDGPQEFHVILLDNGRSAILHDAEAKQTLKCIRCAACQNACPVYRQTGGHAYASVYAGPIGAILTPQLHQTADGRLGDGDSLPYASSLCGACYEVCPVKINIPEVLIHLRRKVVERDQGTISGLFGLWNIGMQTAAAVFESGDRLRLAQRLGRIGQIPFVSKNDFIEHLPLMLSGWTQTRDLAPLPEQSFREWWSERSDRTSHE